MNKTEILSIIFIFVLTICRGQNNDDTTKDTLQFYFPFGTVFNDTSSYVVRQPFHNSWCSAHLHAMKEPVIYTDKSNNEIFRFTWLRTSHHPVAIRIEKQASLESLQGPWHPSLQIDYKYMLYWKVCSGQGGYDPGKLVINEQKTLDERTWKEFLNLLGQVDFWNLQTSERNSKRLFTLVDGAQWETVSIGVDGAHWVLEGKMSPHYHVVDRWAPNKESKYYQCCNFLIQLTDLEISDKDKY